MHRFNILDLRLNRFISKINKVMNSGIHASLYSNCHHQLVKGPFDITCRQNGFNREAVPNNRDMNDQVNFQ